MTWQDMLKQYNIPYTPKVKVGMGTWTIVALIVITLFGAMLALAGLLMMLGWNFVFGVIHPINFVQGVILYLTCRLAVGVYAPRK